MLWFRCYQPTNRPRELGPSHLCFKAKAARAFPLRRCDATQRRAEPLKTRPRGGQGPRAIGIHGQPQPPRDGHVTWPWPFFSWLTSRKNWRIFYMSILKGDKKVLTCFFLCCWCPIFKIVVLISFDFLKSGKYTLCSAQSTYGVVLKKFSLLSKTKVTHAHGI